MTTTRGRYAAARNPLPRRLLAVAAALTFLATLGLAGASAARADVAATVTTGYVSDPYYKGERFASSKICVQLKTSRTWLRDRVKEAVADWDDHTRLVMFVRQDCTGYNKITIRADYYGTGALCAGYRYVGCYRTVSRHWGQTPGGRWTYLVTRAEIRFNLSTLAPLSTARKDHTITHELGHNALRHVSKCGSVMRQDWSCLVRESGSLDRDAINRIYGQ
jgi:hypothetical protein